jgi:F-type H+-transporting ATPase subunit b
MNIQLGVIVTQILGFLIVLFVLRKFAWGPVLGLLEARREKIRQSFEDIEALKTIEAQARQRMNEAVAEGQKLAADIEASARERSRQELEKLKGDVEREYQAARVRFKEEMVTIALGAAERMVRDSLDRQKQSKLVEDFLTDLDTAAREKKV